MPTKGVETDPPTPKDPPAQDESSDTAPVREPKTKESKPPPADPIEEHTPTETAQTTSSVQPTNPPTQPSTPPDPGPTNATGATNTSPPPGFSAEAYQDAWRRYSKFRDYKGMSDWIVAHPESVPKDVVAADEAEPLEHFVEVYGLVYDKHRGDSQDKPLAFQSKRHCRHHLGNVSDGKINISNAEGAFRFRTLNTIRSRQELVGMGRRDPALSTPLGGGINKTRIKDEIHFTLKLFRASQGVGRVRSRGRGLLTFVFGDEKPDTWKKLNIAAFADYVSAALSSHARGHSKFAVNFRSGVSGPWFPSFSTMWRWSSTQPVLAPAGSFFRLERLDQDGLKVFSSGVFNSPINQDPFTKNGACAPDFPYTGLADPEGWNLHRVPFQGEST